ncbi:hypothetical protein COLO4_31786 [Corchorus olitorius]|uniref:Uncharacterized protein n=1 Tax=Corchorus olitorius TaxID=93759 RepID=A0A1R3H389_9ROSI|nr:hypothetical protein COLO4_31786 [Corchorus olitorius]
MAGGLQFFGQQIVCPEMPHSFRVCLEINGGGSSIGNIAKYRARVAKRYSIQFIRSMVESKTKTNMKEKIQNE